MSEVQLFPLYPQVFGLNSPSIQKLRCRDKGTPVNIIHLAMIDRLRYICVV